MQDLTLSLDILPLVSTWPELSPEIREIVFAVVDAGNQLAEPVRVGILAMLKAQTGKTTDEKSDSKAEAEQNFLEELG